MQRDNVRMWWQTLEGLNLSQVVDLYSQQAKCAYLIDVVEVSFHALDGDIFTRFNRLCLEHLRESALALLTYQTVLYRGRWVSNENAIGWNFFRSVWKDSGKSNP
jgi:hypothetical protein